ncbi:hypothetical protein [Paenibacillus beijingensis]|uniref:Uncharacterized protein n=1 Tax=Paenibacillus beijingensis TaxID=1126833 RepID=A0A0D5NEB9_9BACL|nr:hypothetical protein [Paenibacillus beijingensis]AJY73714.1 hypothetical protein VN24_02550 [Paenibacillus beijingensis]
MRKRLFSRMNWQWKRKSARLEHWKAQKSEFDTLITQNQFDYVQLWIDPYYSISSRDLPR